MFARIGQKYKYNFNVHFLTLKKLFLSRIAKKRGENVFKVLI